MSLKLSLQDEYKFGRFWLVSLIFEIEENIYLILSFFLYLKTLPYLYRHWKLILRRNFVSALTWKTSLTISNIVYCYFLFSRLDAFQ